VRSQWVVRVALVLARTSVVSTVIDVIVDSALSARTVSMKMRWTVSGSVECVALIDTPGTYITWASFWIASVSSA